MYACRLERERAQDPQRAGPLCVSVVLFGLVGDASDLGWTWVFSSGACSCVYGQLWVSRGLTLWLGFLAQPTL